MPETVVPGPEPEWERAPQYQGGKRNRALQSSVWEYAARSFGVVAGLSASLEVLTARLRLEVERSWEDLGPVDVAMFRIEKIDFALSRLPDAPQQDVFVWVSRRRTDVEAALDVLLGALGIGREALTFRGTVETGFADFRAHPELRDDPDPRHPR